MVGLHGGVDTFSRPPLRSPPEREVGATPHRKGPGAHFRELRCARGLTQEQLAERADLAADTIRRLEYNNFSPTLVTLEKLARGLRVPPSGVLEGYEQRERKLEGELAGVLEAIDEPQRATFLPARPLLCVRTEAGAQPSGASPRARRRSSSSRRRRIARQVRSSWSCAASCSGPSL